MANGAEHSAVRALSGRFSGHSRMIRLRSLIRRCNTRAPSSQRTHSRKAQVSGKTRPALISKPFPRRSRAGAASLIHPALQCALTLSQRTYAPQHSGRRKDPSGADKQAFSAAFASRRSFAHSSGIAMRAHTQPAHAPRRHSGRRRDLTGSNLWPVRSGCIVIISTCSIVQTRAAPKRRGVGLRARSGVEAAQPPGCVREAVWKRHSRRVACTKRCGCRTAARRGRSGRPGR